MRMMRRPRSIGSNGGYRYHYSRESRGLDALSRRSNRDCGLHSYITQYSSREDYYSLTTVSSKAPCWPETMGPFGYNYEGLILYLVDLPSVLFVNQQALLNNNTLLLHEHVRGSRLGRLRILLAEC